MIKNMEEKKAAKRQASDMDNSTGKGTAAAQEPKIRRAFKQRRLGEGNDNSDSRSISSAPSKPVEGKIKSVLGNVFGR